jgi:hypothetical protein
MRDTLKQVTANGIETFEGENGIKQEFEAFADAIQHGTPHLNTPIETYNDLALLENFVQSQRLSTVGACTVLAQRFSWTGGVDHASYHYLGLDDVVRGNGCFCSRSAN